jgi:SAM-dependent methyltransferase
MRDVYTRLLARWLPGERSRGLKTDLFEEAVTPHHLFATLGPRGVGIDGSLAIVRAARARLTAEGRRPLLVVADLRRLPIRSGVVGHVLSGSSLDHFERREDIATSLQDLARTLAPGGTLVLALDNDENPVVWLRNRLPFGWLHRLGLVPYYVGPTCRRDEARHTLEALGLDVTAVTAIAHAPRMIAIRLVALVERRDWPRVHRTVAAGLRAFERLETWPTRYRTGYYIALRAEKPATRRAVP